MDTLALVLRVILALAVVFGLIWLSYKIAATKARSGPGAKGAEIIVVARQGMTQKAAAILVDSGDKRYLLGITDASVTVIDTLERPVEADGASVPHVLSSPGSAERFAQTLRTTTSQQSAGTPSRLPGHHILDPQTWARAARAVRTGKLA